MIPAFNEYGYLPPGIHPATMAEIEEGFGSSSEIRRVQFESLVWLIDVADACPVRRIILNGSWVTEIAEPNDMDCLLLVDDNFKMKGDAEQQLLAGFPFLDVQLVNVEELEEFIDYYDSDREGMRKGIVELIR